MLVGENRRWVEQEGRQERMEPLIRLGQSWRRPIQMDLWLVFLGGTKEACGL